MNTTSHLADIELQGFCIIERLLGENDIKFIKKALEPWLLGQHMGRNDFEGFRTERVYALLAKHAIFADLVEHSTILAITDALLELDYLLSANLAINCHPGETPQAFHRDGGAELTKGKTNGVSVIWNLDDFTEDNGATEIIPNSQHWESKPDTDSQAVKVTMPRGSALVFSGSLFHRGGANKSNKSRLAITPQYCQPWLRQLENMVLAVSPEVARQYSERVQALLGYSVRSPGFMGMVNGVHPKRLLDDAYRGRKARGDRS